MQNLLESNSNIYGPCVLRQTCQGAHLMGSLICFKVLDLTTWALPNPHKILTIGLNWELSSQIMQHQNHFNFYVQTLELRCLKTS